MLAERIAPVSKVRRMTYDDVDWFMTLGIKRYPPRWDAIRTENWLRNRILVNPAVHLAIRTDKAACVTVLSAPEWLPADWDALVTTVMAEEDANVWKDVIPLLEASRDWSRRKKCVTWKVASETHYDLGPLAKRVGAKPETYWMIDWRG
ncbi:MAG: hypothetical protein J2P48_10965 [Alphaproteobacteria bacterium]|nr:hypothetical protein [Alphaproteobacteria bacterium]